MAISLNRLSFAMKNDRRAALFWRTLFTKLFYLNCTKRFSKLFLLLQTPVFPSSILHRTFQKSSKPSLVVPTFQEFFSVEMAKGKLKSTKRKKQAKRRRSFCKVKACGSEVNKSNFIEHEQSMHQVRANFYCTLDKNLVFQASTKHYLKNK